jgi:hypothetical protein
MSRLDYIEHRSWIILMFFFSLNCVFAFAMAFGVSASFGESHPGYMLAGLGTLILALTAFVLFLAVVSKVENSIIRFFAKLKFRSYIANLKKRLPNH